jgi:hypothetical protein
MPRLLLLLLLLPGSSLVAQGRGDLDLVRVPSPIRLDGDMSDSAWSAVRPLPLTMYSPTPGGEASERTEIRIAYDDQYLYAGGWFFDSRPEEIRVNSLYRDRWSGDDAFAVLVDPFNDNENGLWFLTTPAGVRIDQTISGDARSFNDSWNAVWEVATRITSEGWFAEMRIPLSVLGFQDSGGRVVMGLTVTRLIARNNERVTFPAIDPRHEFRQPSVMQDVVLQDVVARRPVYLTPYLLSGVDRTTSLPAGGSAYSSEDDFVREAGADLKYGIANNFHLDLSLNTDFAQVEADDQQVNLTRFPIFFPEKRQFFQERAGVFDFDLSSGGRLFHSRQIGLAPDRTPIRMLGGARVVARAGGWDVAALDVHTARRDAFPAENLGVLRIKRRVLNQFSYTGGMITSRINEDGGYNLAGGVDASLRLLGNEYLTLRTASTFDDANPGRGLFEQSQLYAQWQRRSNKGLTYSAQFNRAGEQFRPGLGFLPRQNFSRVSLFSEYFFLSDSSRVRSHGPGAIAILWYGNEQEKLETYYLAYWWNYACRGGARGWLEVVHNYENVQTPFELGDGVVVDSGSFKFTELWFNYQPPSGSRFRSLVDARIGGFYDGWRFQFQLDPTWNVSRHLEIGGSYELNRIRFPDRGVGLDAHIARLRIGAAANARLSATALLQFNSVDDQLGVNLRLRYNVREGSDLWLVYDEGFNTERDQPGGLPSLPTSDRRVLRVKLTHTFVPR